MGKKFLSWLPALFGWLTLAVVVWLLGGFCKMLKEADPSLSAMEILRHLAPGLLYASGIGTALARHWPGIPGFHGESFSGSHRQVSCFLSSRGSIALFASPF